MYFNAIYYQIAKKITYKIVKRFNLPFIFLKRHLCQTKELRLVAQPNMPIQSPSCFSECIRSDKNSCTLGLLSHNQESVSSQCHIHGMFALSSNKRNCFYCPTANQLWEFLEASREPKVGARDIFGRGE